MATQAFSVWLIKSPTQRDERDFGTFREAVAYARSLIRGGWLRSEVDVRDQDGSVNVCLP